MSVDSAGNPTSYNVQINEYQRKLILKALNVHVGYASRQLAEEEGDVYDTKLEEINSLRVMLGEMPSEERKAPNLLHGLCL